MKMVVADGYTLNPGDLSWEPLQALGELVVYDRTSFSESPLIAERIGDADIAIVNKTPVSRETMRACGKLKAIAVLATGYNIVDCRAAKELGITVMNVPAYGTQVVAQYAVGLLLEICSHIGHHDRTVHEGRWQKSGDFCYWDYPLIELNGRCAGIIGFGRIGEASARILHAMGMEVLYYDAFPPADSPHFAAYADMDALLSRADVIFLHCPLTPETEGLICRESISRMKDSVILINNSRGQLVRERDLADALASGKVYAAALDVLSTEPVRDDNPLLSAKNCIITPHISWAAKEARKRILQTTAENIQSFLAGKALNVVA